MAILNNLISSLRSTKKQKRELQGHMNQAPRAKKTIESFDDLSLKEKSLLNKLNSSQNPHDFKSQLSKINSLAALEKIKPDLVICMGDRYELLSLGSVITILNIPLAHISGGEVTLGAIDDQIRHSISKLSHFHFVANKKFKIYYS